MMTHTIINKLSFLSTEISVLMYRLKYVDLSKKESIEIEIRNLEAAEAQLKSMLA